MRSPTIDRQRARMCQRFGHIPRPSSFPAVRWWTSKGEREAGHICRRCWMAIPGPFVRREDLGISTGGWAPDGSEHAP